MVSMTTFGTAAAPRVICLVASRPSIPGIRMSISTTSGACAATWDTAASPLAASPTTVIPSAASRMTQNPRRTSSWSSTTSTRIGARIAEAVIAPAAGR